MFEGTSCAVYSYTFPETGWPCKKNVRERVGRHHLHNTMAVDSKHTQTETNSFVGPQFMFSVQCYEQDKGKATSTKEFWVYILYLYNLYAADPLYSYCHRTTSLTFGITHISPQKNLDLLRHFVFSFFAVVRDREKKTVSSEFLQNYSCCYDYGLLRNPWLLPRVPASRVMDPLFISTVASNCKWSPWPKKPVMRLTNKGPKDGPK